MDSSTSRSATSENVFVEDILIYAAWQIKFQTENSYQSLSKEAQKLIKRMCQASTA